MTPASLTHCHAERSRSIPNYYFRDPSYYRASGALPYSPQLIHRPVAKHGFTINIALVYRTEIAAVVRHGPVIPQNEVAIRRNHRLWIRPRIGVGRRNVVFVQCFAVHIHLSAVDTDAISGYSDYAFYVALGRIARIAENDDISTGNRLQPIDEFVDEDALLVFKRRHHAGAFDFYRLVDEYDDEG